MPANDPIARAASLFFETIRCYHSVLEDQLSAEGYTESEIRAARDLAEEMADEARRDKWRIGKTWTPRSID